MNKAEIRKWLNHGVDRKIIADLLKVSVHTVAKTLADNPSSVNYKNEKIIEAARIIAEKRKEEFNQKLEKYEKIT